MTTCAPAAAIFAAHPATTSFRLLLPLGQLLLSAVLILIVCGPRTFLPSSLGTNSAAAGSIERPAPQPDPATERATQTRVQAFRLIGLANLPGGVLQAPIAALSRHHHGRLVPGLNPPEVLTVGPLGWSVLAIPFWWIAGRGIEALAAIRRNVVAPRIHWVELLPSWILLAGVGSLAIACFLAIALGHAEPGYPSLGVSELLWAFLGGITVLAHHKQRRSAGRRD